MQKSQIRKQVTVLIGRLSIVVAMLVLVACGDSVSEAQMIEAAKGYLAKGQISNAAIEIKNTLQANPDSAEGRYLLARVNMIAGDYASAEKDFKRAATLGWHVPASVLGELRAQVELRKFEEVIDRVIDVKTWSLADQANAQALKAISYAATDDMLQAKNALNFAEKLDAEAYNVLKVKAQFQLLDKQSEAAKVTLEKALKAYPDDVALLLLKANLEILDDDKDKALATYQQIIANDNKKFLTPDVRAAHIGVMKLAVAAKDYALFEREKKTLLASNKNDYEAFYYIAVAAFEQKKYEEAHEYVSQILNRVERHAPSLLLAGSVNFAQRNFEQAARYLSMYVADNPNNIKARKLLGRTYMALGQHDAAQKAFGTVLKKASDDAELIALMGLSEISGGRVQSGIDELKKALELAPDSSSLRLELAKAYVSEGQTADAIDVLDAVLIKGDMNYLAQSMKVFVYVQAKDFAAATSTGQELLAASPDNAEVLSLMGAVSAAAGDEPKAREYFNQALMVDDSYVRATVSLARLDEAEGELEAAQSRYLSLLKKSPNDTASMLSLARLAQQRGDTDAQVKWLQKAREADKKQMIARVTLAELALVDGNLSEVEALVRELKEENAEHPAVLAIESRLLMAQKRYTQADVVLEKLIEDQPKLDIGYYLQGQNQISLNNVEGALSNLRKAYSLNGDVLRNIVLLARVEQSAGNSDRALVLGKKVLLAAPDSAAGHVIVGDAQMSSGEYKQALASFNKAWALIPGKKVVTRRFKAAFKVSGINDASTIYKEWLEKHPEDVEIINELASTYLIEKMNKQAIAYFEKGLALQPDNVTILNNLAWLYNLEGDSRALALSTRAYKLKPKVASIADTHGWILLREGKKVEALKRLRQAYASLSQVPDVQYHYAKALYVTGDKEAAITILKPLVASAKKFDGRTDAERLIK